MTGFSTDCRIVYSEELRDGVHALTFEAVGLTPAQPGQFVHIKCGGGDTTRVLRRPISVADYFEGDAANNVPPEITVVFEVRGDGTQWLAERREDNTLDVLGALGHGFEVPTDGQILLVGGGLGVAPLMYVANANPLRCNAILGFRTAELILLSGEFDRLCRRVVIATDDGSYGERGTVAEPVRAALKSEQYAAVFACGPRPMLRSVAAIAAELNVPCQVSLEERMACGVGACLGCAVETKNGIRRVCRDGPVFDAQEVVW
ncbi:MAG: dihydroorotate dehydrogenase electron transfer subunit [Oscillospiraceae bacterium]|jgi:dihydroorotate dehydrogenase electron transfer subunit|nr:dihydroorotate dehydrogenase electron transfer subunit [Oscillospiraceae bacterium]